MEELHGESIREKEAVPDEKPLFFYKNVNWKRISKSLQFWEFPGLHDNLLYYQLFYNYRFLIFKP